MSSTLHTTQHLHSSTHKLTSFTLIRTCHEIEEKWQDNTMKEREKAVMEYLVDELLDARDCGVESYITSVLCALECFRRKYHLSIPALIEHYLLQYGIELEHNSDFILGLAGTYFQ